MLRSAAALGVRRRRRAPHDLTDTSAGLSGRRRLRLVFASETSPSVYPHASMSAEICVTV